MQWPKKYWTFGIALFASFLFIAFLKEGQAAPNNQEEGVLQGSIHLHPTQQVGGDNEKILPGTALKISVTVENHGKIPSPAGELFVRFAFAHPLHQETNSNIFQTEKKPFASLQPGQKIDISFDLPQKTPNLIDFLRNDWSMREYQAIAEIDGKEYLIGTLALTFSAHYYPGIKKEFPVKIN